MSIFDALDTVQQRETYIKARRYSEFTDNPIIVHCRVLGGAFSYSNVFKWDHWNSMEVCRFRRGREL